MSFWAIIDPESGTNLVCNPSAETTGNYAPIGAAVTQSTDQARHGIRAWKVVTAGTSQGLFLFCTTATNTTHYASAYIRGTVTGTISFSANSGTNKNAASVIGGHAGGFVRYGVALPPAQTSNSPYLSIFDSANDGTLYIDAVQLEPNAGYPTTYIDGDREGLYRWNGLRHGSSSTRDAMERSGGVERDLDTYYGIRVRPTFQGVGMPPIQNNFQQMALQPGTLLQSQKVMPRELQLDLLVNNITTSTTWQNLHRNRQSFINLVKPDRARGAQPFTLRYTGDDAGAGASPLYAKFVYADGLGFNGNNLVGFHEEPPVKLVAPDPFWYEDNQETVNLTLQQSLTTASGIIGKVNNNWQLLGTGTTGSFSISAKCLLSAKNNMLYAGGYFDVMGGVANTTNIAQWNGARWAAMGTGVTTNANGFVEVLAQGSDGSIYAGGGFTRMGGVVGTTALARWNGLAWNTVGGGLGGPTPNINALAIDPDSNLYAGGSGFVIAGVSNTTNLAKWSGVAWSSITPTPTTGTIYALAFGKDGALYVGGTFSYIGSLNASNIAKYKNGTWATLNTGISGIVYALSVAGDGSLYVGGAFTTAGGVQCNNVAKWDGTGFSPLGQGVQGSARPVNINGLTCLSGNQLYINGSFTTAGGDTIYSQSVLWNGYGYLPSELRFPSAGEVYSTVQSGNGDTYIAYSVSGTARTAAQTTVSPQTNSVFPKITIVGPTTAGTTAALFYLENQSSRERLYFSENVQGGETITIDLATNKKTVVSDWTGTINGQPLAGSDLAAFHLLPTTNTLALFMIGQVTTTSGTAAILQYTPAHWSADGGA